MPCAGPAVLTAGCRAWPSAGSACSSGQCAPRRRTRPLAQRGRGPSRARFRPDGLRSCFKKIGRAVRLRVVARARGQLAVVHGPQLAAQRLLGHRHVMLFPQPLAQIDQPPAHHAMHRRGRSALDRRRQRRPVRVSEPGRLARRLAVEQPLGPWALSLSTQSRTICSVTPPIMAASVRLAPS